MSRRRPGAAYCPVCGRNDPRLCADCMRVAAERIGDALERRGRGVVAVISMRPCWTHAKTRSARARAPGMLIAWMNRGRLLWRTVMAGRP